MEDNLARELELDIELSGDSVAYEQQIQQPYGEPAQEVAPSIQPIPQAAPLTKGLTKLEIGLIAIMGTIVFALLLFNVYS